jgi:hypothetical protein
MQGRQAQGKLLFAKVGFYISDKFLFFYNGVFL